MAWPNVHFCYLNRCRYTTPHGTPHTCKKGTRALSQHPQGLRSYQWTQLPIEPDAVCSSTLHSTQTHSTQNEQHTYARTIFWHCSNNCWCFAMKADRTKWHFNSCHTHLSGVSGCSASTENACICLRWWLLSGSNVRLRRCAIDRCDAAPPAAAGPAIEVLLLLNPTLLLPCLQQHEWQPRARSIMAACTYRAYN